MSKKRTYLNEDEVKTVLAIIECFQEQNHYRFEEMNKTMGNLTIEDMMKLQNKLTPEKEEYPYEYEDDLDDDYNYEYSE